MTTSAMLQTLLTMISKGSPASDQQVLDSAVLPFPDQGGAVSTMESMVIISIKEMTPPNQGL